MSKNPVQSLDYLELAKAQIKCSKIEMAVEILKAITKDLEDFLEECKKGD